MINSINYEGQEFPETQRRCGAAALTMALRAFGIEAEQERLWNALKTPVPGSENEFRVETYRIAQQARCEGLGVILGRLRDPWNFLLLQKPFSVHNPSALILNHRTRLESPLGHFSVFLRTDAEKELVFLHDPQRGPERAVTKTELLALWSPLGKPCEITGRIALRFAPKDAFFERCRCRWCESVLELPDSPKIRENWSRLFCPECGKADPQTEKT